MTYYDSPRAELDALAAELNAMAEAIALSHRKAGNPCQRCGRPLVRLEGRSNQPFFTCCLACEAAAEARDSGVDED
jgi:hypothetical protein